MNGLNPMRWDCEKRGCFNTKRRPKIEVFHDCFPGRINFSDVDAIVEISGCFLLMEWKSHADELPTGQRIMFERMTADRRFAVIVVCGNAETMEIERFSMIFDGRQRRWITGDVEALKDMIKRWVKYASELHGWAA